MKKYILMLMMLSCAVFTTTSCEKEDGDEMEEYVALDETTDSNFNVGSNSSNTSASKSIPVEDLPSLITDYIATNYPEASILKAEQEEDGSYEVYLDNELEVEFDAEGNFIKEETESDDGREGDDDDDSDDDDSDSDDHISIEELPALIIDYIGVNYPENTIVEAEREDDGGYEVELDNGLEIKFDADGNFIEEEMESEDDDDEEGDDDEISIEELPVVITDYISANYPNNTIVEAEREDDGGYEVELDNGLELIFDENGVFIKED